MKRACSGQQPLTIAEELPRGPLQGLLTMGLVLRLNWGSVGSMEKKMETIIIMGYIGFRVWGLEIVTSGSPRPPQSQHL